MKNVSALLLGLSLLFSFSSGSAQTTYQYYYGNLHSHTGYSDGSKDSLVSGIRTPFQSYAYAKSSLHFDFLGISEHNHATAGMHLPNYHLGIQQADSANDDGTFVALFGMEWGTISSGGHLLIYGYDELIGWETNNFDQFVAKGDYPSLWNKINARAGAFAMCCHPVSSDFGNIRNGAFNPAANAALVGTAFRSGPAFSTNALYTNPSSGSFESYYKGLLARGYHVGPTYDHDNHNTTFGRTTEGRLVVLAPSLTRANLLHAFRNRAFFASDDWNAQVMLTVNTHHIMGAIVQQPGAPLIQATLTDLDAEGHTVFQLLKGVPGSGQMPVVVATATTGASALSFTDGNLANGDSAYYYVSVSQADGDKIITAPIWYTRGPLLTASPEAEETKPELLVWPNPLAANQTRITIATPAQGHLLILDQLGRTVKTAVASANGTTVTIEELAPGVYVILYYSEEGSSITAKLLVE